MNATHRHVSSTRLSLTLWASNLTLTPAAVAIDVKVYHIATGQLLFAGTPFPAFIAQANRSTSGCDDFVIDLDEAGGEWDTVAVAYLMERDSEDQTRKTLARAMSWPQPLRYCPIQPDPAGLEITVGVEKAGRREVMVKSNVPVKGLVLEAPVDGDSDVKREVDFSDNGFDVVPGDAISVSMKNYIGGELTAWWLNKHLNLECERE
jgi:hypothetical protein